MSAYEELLGYTKSVVTRNYAEKSVNSMLNRLSSGEMGAGALMERCYDVTLRSLEEQKNDVWVFPFFRWDSMDKPPLRILPVLQNQNSDCG